MNLRTPAVAMCAVVCALLAGTIAIIEQSESRVATRAQANDLLLAQLNADERVVRELDATTRDQRRLRADLRRLVDADDPIPPMSRFLQDAARIVQAHHVTISAVSAAGMPTASSPVLADSLENSQIVLTLEGPYIEVLSVTRRLSDLRVPAVVEIVSIVRANRPEGVVTATLHVALVRASAVRA
jgi:Tfp pilus assembly protein PilN